MNVLTRAMPWLGRNARPILFEAAFNFVLPLAIFVFAKPRIGEFDALIASSGPPIAWSLGNVAFKRRLDAISILVLAGIALSGLAILGGGSPRLLLLRGRMVTILIGLAFLASAAIRRPLIYYLAHAMMRKNNPSEADRLQSLRDDIHVRRSMTVLTLVWGCGMVAEASLSALLVFRLEVRDYMIVSPIIGYSTTAALALFTFFYVRHRRRRGDALRAAAAGQAPGGSP